MIRFVRPNHYRKQVGDLAEFNFGIEDTLVRRGIAEFVETETVAAISEPVAKKPSRRTRRKLEEN